VEQHHQLPDLRARLHPLLGLSKKGNGVIHSVPANNNRVQHDSTAWSSCSLAFSARPARKKKSNFKASSFHFHLSWDDGRWLNCPVPRQPVNNDGGQGKARNDNRSDLSAAVLFWSTTQGSLFTLVEQ
jgi:hypothetical protein